MLFIKYEPKKKTEKTQTNTKIICILIESCPTRDIDLQCLYLG